MDELTRHRHNTATDRSKHTLRPPFSFRYKRHLDRKNDEFPIISVTSTQPRRPSVRAHDFEFSSGYAAGSGQAPAPHRAERYVEPAVRSRYVKLSVVVTVCFPMSVDGGVGIHGLKD